MANTLSYSKDNVFNFGNEVHVVRLRRLLSVVRGKMNQRELF